MKKPLRLILFVFIFSHLVFFSSNAYAFGVYLTNAGAEIKWSSPTATYLINASGGPAGSLDDLQAAMQTWTAVTTSRFTFIYGGTTTSTDHDNIWPYDSVNIVTFAPMGLNGTLAENAFWYYSNGDMIDSDIQFNTSYSWNTNGSAGYFDVQNIGTHEFGHSLSLADLYDASDSEKTMYGYGSAGETKKRTLDPDEIDGITYLYPCTYSINPTSETLSCPSGAGSSINVTTQSSCPWTAVSNNAWITITSGSSGSSSGTVGYSVSENTGQSSKTGTISMSGQIFTTSSLWEVTDLYGNVTRYRTGTITAAAFPSSFTVTQTVNGGYTLTVSTSGTGTVTSSPAGIDCGATCSFSTCQTVTLTATPGTCLALTGWSGACSGTGTCTVAMDAAKAVTATFGLSAPVADFTCLPSSGTVPLTVNFTDTSTCSPTSWSWDLSDSATSTLQNPSHVYNPDLGNNLTVSYNISLTATNATGSNTLTKTSCVTAQCASSPVKIVRTGTTYSTIQAAYDAALTGDTIQCQGYRLTENLNVNRNINVTLDGGYGCDYSSNTGGVSELKGQLRTWAGGGKLTIKNFKIVN